MGLDELRSAVGHLPAGADPFIGRVVGSYRVERELLGRGGMGRVYLGRHTALETPGAVKVFAPHGGMRPDLLERFRRSCLLAAKLRHPNVVAVLDGGLTADQPFVVMQFVEGRSIGDVLAERSRLPPDEARAFVRTVAGALGYLHAQGIIHRDIKPSNVLVSSAGDVLLSDFDLLRSVNPTDGGSLTKTGTTIGTAAYMSPEQINGRDIGSASEVFSLGAMWYELLTGEPPFGRGALAEVAARVLMRAPEPLRGRCDGIGDAEATLVLRTLARDPASRPADMPALIAAIDEVAAAASSGADAGGDVEPETTGGRTSSRRAPVAAAARSTSSRRIASSRARAVSSRVAAGSGARRGVPVVAIVGVVAVLAFGAGIVVASRRSSPPEGGEAPRETATADDPGAPRAADVAVSPPPVETPSAGAGAAAAPPENGAPGGTGADPGAEPAAGVVPEPAPEPEPAPLPAGEPAPPAPEAPPPAPGAGAAVSEAPAVGPGGEPASPAPGVLGPEPGPAGAGAPPPAAAAGPGGGEPAAAPAGAKPAARRVPTKPFAVPTVERSRHDDHGRWVTSLFFDLDGTHLFTASGDGTVKLRAVADGKVVRTWQARNKEMTAADLSPDGTLLAVADGKEVRVLSVETGDEVATLGAHDDVIRDLAWSPDGRLIATGSHDKTARIWSLEEKTLAAKLEGHTDNIISIAWSPDGRVLATASADNTARLWSAAGKSKGVLQGHTKEVVAVCWSPDGKAIATGGNDRTVKLWSVSRGAVVKTLGHAGGDIFDIAWSPEGTLIATAGGDRTVRVFSARDGRMLQALAGHAGSVIRVAWSPDGLLASGCWEHRVRIWAAK